MISLYPGAPFKVDSVDLDEVALHTLEGEGCPHSSEGELAFVEECNESCGLNRKLVATNRPIYGVLAAHQRAEESWDLHKLATLLDEWWHLLNQTFDLQIPRTALRLEYSIRRNCLGYFNPGHNEFGLVNEIALGIRQHMDEKGLDFGDLVGSLLHEGTHLWQHLHGEKSEHGHHNQQFRDKTRSFGLIVDYRGRQTYERSSRFVDLLLSRGVEPPRCLLAQAGGNGAPPPGKKLLGFGSGGNSKLKKWSCYCQPPINVRVAITDFQAVCLKCGQAFERRA
jgi:hypothetical protein